MPGAPPTSTLPPDTIRYICRVEAGIGSGTLAAGALGMSDWSNIFSGWPSIAALALGYLLGSIPFGLIFTRLTGGPDIRSIGSGNIGATNVLRTGRKGLAAATLLADALKGTLAVIVAGMWGPNTALLAALGAFLGHLFPVWLGFKGGKGVATFLGCLLGLRPVDLPWRAPARRPGWRPDRPRPQRAPSRRRCRR